ncbi:hypothetical protein LAL4801_05720 [Roseibium aggregatum]|uniref:Uncharacterized protein n=2 Tax=Roseibium aggregatum TaxID=187304 RepID=A0A0M6YC48_9HYPH|nr:hypothetical protein LAL4801_05720 [Roseibium aggregatum]
MDNRNPSHPGEQSISRRLMFRVRDLAYLLVSIAVGGAAYFAFRVMYFGSETVPFAQEMVLVFLGAVATIYLTAVLLNRQTELELRKEGQVIILQQKNDIYMACIEKVAEIVETARHDDDLIDELRVLNHKLAVLGSSDVIASFEKVLDSLISGLGDGKLNSNDGSNVMNAVAEMTSAMRKDILEEIVAGNMQKTRESILRNSNRMQRLDQIDLGSSDREVKR